MVRDLGGVTRSFSGVALLQLSLVGPLPPSRKELARPRALSSQSQPALEFGF